MGNQEVEDESQYLSWRTTAYTNRLWSVLRYIFHAEALQAKAATFSKRVANAFGERPLHAPLFNVELDTGMHDSKDDNRALVIRHCSIESVLVLVSRGFVFIAFCCRTAIQY